MAMKHLIFLVILYETSLFITHKRINISKILFFDMNHDMTSASASSSSASPSAGRRPRAITNRPPDLMTRNFVELAVSGTAVRLATLSRAGERPLILFLHGFGSTKEDFADLAVRPEFAGSAFLAFDAPGCGESECADFSALSIPFHFQATKDLIDHLSPGRFHLVGHSMGGLTALLLAHEAPERIISFTNIEGNLTPEDCFWSRRILEYKTDDDRAFFDAFVERVRGEESPAGTLFAAGVRNKVRTSAIRPLFESIVELSGKGDLLNKFIGLPIPKMFMFGDANGHLPYLGLLQRKGIQMAQISGCGHFPMYSNPPEMWRNLARFIEHVEA